MGRYAVFRRGAADSGHSQMPDTRFSAGLKVAAVSVKKGSREGVALPNHLPHTDRNLTLEMGFKHFECQKTPQTVR